jgi:hypothetical protein
MIVHAVASAVAHLGATAWNAKQLYERCEGGFAHPRNCAHTTRLLRCARRMAMCVSCIDELKRAKSAVAGWHSAACFDSFLFTIEFPPLFRCTVNSAAPPRQKNPRRWPGGWDTPLRNVQCAMPRQSARVFSSATLFRQAHRPAVDSAGVVHAGFWQKSFASRCQRFSCNGTSDPGSTSCT